jgi:hypothetical protein
VAIQSLPFLDAEVAAPRRALLIFYLASSDGRPSRSKRSRSGWLSLNRAEYSPSIVSEFLLQKQVTNKFTVAAVLQTDFILEVLRREIRRMSSGVKVEVDYLRSLLREEVLKRDLVDGDEAKAALQNIRRLQRAATRKKGPASKPVDDAPIVAPVEDASASLPRAIVAS